jgi:hypothetical protein
MISRYHRHTLTHGTVQNYYKPYQTIMKNTAPSNSTRVAHSSNSYPNTVDIRNITTKIIGITLTTHRITTENQ